MPRARLIGINHVALEVGDLDAALALYGRLFAFELRGRAGRMAFVDMGDQFLALSEGRAQGPDDGRHFGLVVDDKEAVRAAVAAEGLPTRRPAARSTSSTRGATASRSSPMPTSSSSARPASSASSASRRSRRRSGRAGRSPSAGSAEAASGPVTR